MRKEHGEGRNKVIDRVMDGKGLVLKWIMDEVNGNIQSVLSHAIRPISWWRSHGFQKLQLR